MLTVIIMVIFSLAGFVLGKYYGKLQGFEEGITAARLQIRQESLEKGYCVVCNSQESETNISINDPSYP